MSRSTRMFEIIQLLRSSKSSMTAQSIADELEVNKRTVYRDIVSLQAMRVPIDGEAGIGYIMRPGFDLPPLMFSVEEVEAIAVGLSLLGRTGDSALQSAADGVSRKIAAVLPSSEIPSVSEVSLYTSQWHSIIGSDVKPQDLRRFIREENSLEIEYEDKQGEVSHRTVLPLALVYHIEVVLLGAWCELRKDFRHFRVDRILACQQTDLSFSSEGRELRKAWRTVHQFG